MNIVKYCEVHFAFYLSGKLGYEEMHELQSNVNMLLGDICDTCLVCCRYNIKIWFCANPCLSHRYAGNILHTKHVFVS
jgi:hypothetical protein